MLSVKDHKQLERIWLKRNIYKLHLVEGNCVLVCSENYSAWTLFFFTKKLLCVRAFIISGASGISGICGAWIYRSTVETVKYIIKHYVENSSHDTYWSWNLGTCFFDVYVKTIDFINHNSWKPMNNNSRYLVTPQFHTCNFLMRPHWTYWKICFSPFRENILGLITNWTWVNYSLIRFRVLSG